MTEGQLERVQQRLSALLKYHVHMHIIEMLQALVMTGMQGYFGLHVAEILACTGNLRYRHVMPGLSTIKEHKTYYE